MCRQRDVISLHPHDELAAAPSGRRETLVNIRAGKLVKELETINKRSFQMALSVHKDSSLSSGLASEASLLKKRLVVIADEIEQINPAVHKEWFHRISESLLDLDFVIENSGITSLRLGDIIRWGR